MKKECRGCVFFEIEAMDVSKGICRRNPPTVFVMPDPTGRPGFLSAYAPTQGKSWCGEHQPKISMAKEA